MKSIVFLATALAVVATTMPANAGTGCEKAENLAKAGVLLFKAEQYGDALKQFQAAYRLFRPPKCFIDNVVWNIGRCHEEMDEPEMALRFFEQFRKHVEKIGDANRIAAATDKIGHLRERMPGVLVLDVSQSDAVVSVDGEFRGKVSEVGSISVKPGSRTIVVSAPGHVQWKERLVIEGGKSLNIKVSLQPNTGTLKVESDSRVSGAVSVVVDGKLVHDGDLPVSTELAAGFHDVVVTRGEVKFLTKRIEIMPAGKAVLTVVIPEKPINAVIEPGKGSGNKEEPTVFRTDDDGFVPIGPGTVAKSVGKPRFSPAQTGLFWGGIGVALAGAAFNLVGYFEVQDIGNGSYTYDDARNTRDGAAWKYYAGYACYGLAGALVLSSFVIPDYGKKHALGFVIFPSVDGGSVAMTGRF